MATIRPLFVAFFSRSKLFGSTSYENTYQRSTGAVGFSRKKANKGVDELELQSGLSKTIRITTTVTNTQPSLPGRSREAGKNSNESERALKAEEKWGTYLDTHTIEDVGCRTSVKGGQMV
jgi:hypothetical protein